jgi:hypothetical protein
VWVAPRHPCGDRCDYSSGTITCDAQITLFIIIIITIIIIIIIIVVVVVVVIT